MKEYKIRILTQNGPNGCWVTETLTAIRFDANRSYYYFITKDGKEAFYPVANTIVEQL
jgi:hypothetical protein